MIEKTFNILFGVDIVIRVALIFYFAKYSVTPKETLSIRIMQGIFAVIMSISVISYLVR